MFKNLAIKNWKPTKNGTLNGSFSIFVWPLLIKNFRLLEEDKIRRVLPPAMLCHDAAGNRLFDHFVCISGHENYQQFQAWCLDKIDKIEKNQMTDDR